jgi:hypothetical protein
MAVATSPRVGLFLATWDIGTGLPGAPNLHLAVTVNTPQGMIQGFGTITQAVAPPGVDVNTQVHGSYAILIFGGDEQISVSLSGYPVYFHIPPMGGHGPVLMPNFGLHMLLDDDWQSGTASYWYLDSQGQRQNVDNVPVKLVPPAGPTP